MTDLTDSLLAYEAARLEALYNFDILDTDAEKCFDELTELAAYICRTPVAIISFIDQKRAWAKSSIGTSLSEVPRELTFCTQAIKQPDLFLVQDASKDKRFSHLPYVIESPKIMFYAGAPLITSDGFELGTLCVLDYTSRTLDEHQQEALRTLSRQVVSQLELRRNFMQMNIVHQESAQAHAKLEANRDDLERKIKQRTSWLAQMNSSLQQEIVKRKCIQKETLFSKSLTERIVASSPDCIKRIDLEGNLQWMSDGGITVMELCNLKNLVGKRWAEIWPIEERAIVSEAVESALKGNTERFEAFCPTAKGTPKWWDVIVAPLMDANENTECLIATSRDITDRRHIEIALRDQIHKSHLINQRKAATMGRVATELRTPLRLIRHKFDKLKSQKLQYSGEIESIDEQVRTLSNLVDGLYDVSRMHIGSLKLHREYVSLGDVIASALSVVSPLFKERKQQLNVDMSPAWIDADPMRLSQAIARLLDNAARYTHKHGCIKLIACCHNTNCTIKIQDNGVGITEDMIGQIFDPYFQVEKSDSQRRNGLGVGLTLAHNIVELHGGHLSVSSGGLDQGSEFTITLPSSQIEKKPVNTDDDWENGEVAVEQSSHCILVVNESQQMADSLSKILMGMGYHVLYVCNENDAIEAIYSNRIEVALFDVRSTSDVAGNEMARIVREEFRNSPLQMIALVDGKALDQTEHYLFRIENLFDTILAHPVTRDTLDQVMQKVLV